MKKQQYLPTRQRAQRGMAMIEALMAVLILAIGIIGTLGLQVNSQKALNEAGMRSEATIAANELIGVINADIEHAADYALSANGTPGERLEDWHESLLKQLPPGASATVALTDQDDATRTEVVIEISWQRDPEAKPNVHRIVTYLVEAT